MDGLISTFHIDYKIIIAQIINFAIVFVVLYIFALKPLGKLMHNRREEIEKGLSYAKESKDELIIAKQKAEEEIKKARIKINDMIGEARQKGDDMIIKAQDIAKKEAQKIKNQAEKDIIKERIEIEKSIYQKTAHLVALGVSKILEEDVDDKRNVFLNKKAVDFLKENQNI